MIVIVFYRKRKGIEKEARLSNDVDRLLINAIQISIICRQIDHKTLSCTYSHLFFCWSCYMLHYYIIQNSIDDMEKEFVRWEAQNVLYLQTNWNIICMEVDWREILHMIYFQKFSFFCVHVRLVWNFWFVYYWKFLQSTLLLTCLKTLN